MKRFMMIVAVLVGMAAAGASTARADHRHYGRSASSFSISFGNGFNNFAYSSGRPGFGHPYGGYGGYHGGYGVYPVYRPVPVYSVPVYGVPVYGGGFGGYGRGYRHCR